MDDDFIDPDQVDRIRPLLPAAIAAVGANTWRIADHIIPSLCPVTARLARAERGAWHALRAGVEIHVCEALSEEGIDHDRVDGSGDLSDEAATYEVLQTEGHA